MKPHLCLAVIILAAAMFVSSAEAGLVMAYKQTEHGRPATTTTVYVERDRMRSESKGEGREQVVIFRGDKKLYWLINKEKGTYTEITREDMKKLRDKMAEARRTYEAQMKNMPPAQRQMMESMMKGRMPAQPPRTVYRKVASGVKVNRWVCDRYEGVQGGKKSEEVWTTAPAQFRMQPEDFRVFEEMSEFMEEFSKQGLRFFRVEKNAKKGPGIAGVPVRVDHYDRGNMQGRMELTDVRRQQVSPSLFELPTGLKKRTLGL